MMSLFVELIQIALGTRNNFSEIPSENDWQLIYETAAKQCLVGVVFFAIEILNKQDSAIKPPMPLFYHWLGEVTRIEQQNKKLNEAAGHLTSIFKNGGLRSCVLKGQGVARLYDVRCKKSDVRSTSCRTVELRAKDNSPEKRNLKPETNTGSGVLSLQRQPGDIDIWVEGGRDDILNFLKENHLKTGKIVIHHVDASIIEGAETEVHFLPSYTYIICGI